MTGHADGAERHERGLRIAQVVLSVLTIAAFVIAIDGLTRITASRRDAARDSCILLLGLVHAAAPSSRSVQVRQYIDRTPLRDCNQYARTVVK